MYAATVSQNEPDDDGDSVIPASQRPDGTWRKARRVKKGYVPQEEVPLYESKAKQLQNKHVTITKQLPPGQVAHKTIPGLFIRESVDNIKTKTKKKTNKDLVSDITDQLKDAKITSKVQQTKTTATDPARKLKNLKKRLREIETLEEKLKSGKTKPDADQLTKLKRKPDLLKEIYLAEKSV